MPVYDITDERTGRKFKLEGDSEPTELELEEIFASQSEPEPPQLPAGSIPTPPRGFDAVPDILSNPLDPGRGAVAGWSEPMEQQNESFPKLLADVGAGTVGAGMELMDKGVTGALNLPTTAANYLRGQAPGMAGYTEPRFKAGEATFNLFNEFTPEELAKMSPGEQRAAGIASAVGKSANMLTTPGNLATLPLITGKIAKPVASAILGNLALSEPAAIERAIEVSRDPNATPFEAAEAVGEAAVVNPGFAALLGSSLRTPKGPAPAPRLSPEIEAAAARGGSPVRRLGLKIPEGEFAQPGILPLADAALREAQSPIQVPNRTPAIELLRNELQPPKMDLVDPTKSIIPGGGPAVGGKLTFMRPGEALAEGGTAALGSASPKPKPIQLKNKPGERPQAAIPENPTILDIIESPESSFRDWVKSGGNSTKVKNNLSIEELIAERDAYYQEARTAYETDKAAGGAVGDKATGLKQKGDLIDQIIKDAESGTSLRVTDAESPIASIESTPLKDWAAKKSQSGFKDQTAWSYDFAEKNPNVSAADLLEAKKRAIERGKAEGFPDQGMMNQFFSEAAKWRQALDEAKKLENPSKEQLGAIEQEIGVGGMDRGAELQAALKREGESLSVKPKWEKPGNEGAALGFGMRNETLQAPGGKFTIHELLMNPKGKFAANFTDSLGNKKHVGVFKNITDAKKAVEAQAGSSLKAEPKTVDLSETVLHDDVVGEVGKLKQEFPGGLEVVIVDSYQKLPDSIHQTAYRQGANPIGVSGAVSGGKVYINSANIGSLAEVRQIFLHEQAGHFATDKTLGPKLQKFMGQVHESFKNDPLMTDTASRYKEADATRLGREFVARLAENPKANPTAWNKIVAQFRSWLRDIGWVKKVTDNDIQVLLSRAMDSLKKQEAGMSPDDISLSLKSATDAANERFPSAKQNKPGVGEREVRTDVLAPKPKSGATTTATLDDIYKIFEPEKKASPTLKQRAVNIAEAFRTGVSSKFRPVNKLAEDIAKSYGLGKPKDIAGIMEQLKGSQGKGEAEVFRFDRDVAKLVKGSEKDFNAYMFLRRSLDRLEQDAADIAKAQAGGNVPNLNRRAVAGYTINQLTPKLQALEAKLGPEKLKQFEDAAVEYQGYMNDALVLQVESGRMSPKMFKAIKEGNQFYAPFKVMKYLEESSKPAGAGKRIDTTADFTKAMEGIEDPNFKLGDMLGAARQGILMSRILADKNTAMRNIAELSAFDTRGDFIKKLAPTADAPRGWEAVNVFENGKQNRYAVQPEVAEAIQLYGGNAGGVISRALSYSSIPFRAGATALNIPFQISNLLADQPRAALISKYGLRSVNDLINYPMDFVHALFASIGKDVFGVNSKLMFDFLDSGVAGTTVQEYLTPDALKFREPSTISKSRKLASSVINTLPNFAQAIEQVSKVLGVKRAMRFEGVTDGKQLAKQVPEAITELRRFSGSPDFGRQGKWVEQARLNLLYMFLNARIQGTVADVGRLAGRDGKGTAAQTWAKIGAAVGIPTAYLYFLNQRPEFKEDYDSRPDDEKRNYWLIPKETFIVNDDGEKMRDYWRIPKREVSKWVANLTETALDFAKQRDPENLLQFGEAMIEEISPVNVTGETAQERLESIGASLNPLVKAPLEFAMGRDMYRHKEIMSDQMSKASPEMQFTPRTAEAFKKLAEAMPDIAPDVLRSPLMLENLTRNMTAGLITQFMPRKPVEGRSGWENNPLLARFQAVPYKDNSEFRDEVTQLEREAADEQLTRHRTATKLIDDNKGLDLAAIVEKAPRDERLIKHMADLWVAKENGITGQERQLLALPVRQRAAYIANKLRGLDAAQKDEMIMDLGRKRILTEAVFQELGQLMEEK